MAVKKHFHAGAPRAEKSYLPNLPKTERLSNPKKISSIYKNPARKIFFTPSIKITAVPGDSWEIAISIKKGVGNAVTRNYVKRKIRECYRLTKPVLKKAFSVIFQVKRNPDTDELNTLNKILYTELKK